MQWGKCEQIAVYNSKCTDIYGAIIFKRNALIYGAIIFKRTALMYGTIAFKRTALIYIYIYIYIYMELSPLSELH